MAMRSPPGKTGQQRRRTKAGMEPAAADSLGARLDLDAARLVVIHDVWSGMNDDAPFASSFELRRDEPGALVGTVRVFRRGRFDRTQEIMLNASAATKFLRRLADAPLRPGPYTPFMDHTDDFPSIEIAVHVGPEARANGLVLLHSSSQGDFHAPWSIAIRGELFTSPGEEIGRALAMVRELVRDERGAGTEETVGQRMAKAMADEFRASLKPGEVMSRQEALAYGGEEMGPLIYRLANSERGSRHGARGPRKKGG